MKCRSILLFLVPLLLAGCNLRPREIPEDKLVAIVSDIFVANAYWDSGEMADSLKRDSVDIYTPIFKRYGYKTSDFRYTLNNLSKRKSIRLTDILERAQERLKEMNGPNVYKIAVLDSLDAMAAELFKKEVYFDTIVRLKKLKRVEDDPDVEIDLEPGTYIIEYRYLIDSADENVYVQYAHFLTDTADLRTNFTYRSYTMGRPRNEKLTLEVKDTSRTKKLNLLLAYTNTKLKKGEKAKKTAVEVDSLRITHYLPKEVAYDSLSLRVRYHSPDAAFPVRMRYDETEEDDFAEDYVTLRLDTARVAPVADSLVLTDGGAGVGGDAGGDR